MLKASNEKRKKKNHLLTRSCLTKTFIINSDVKNMLLSSLGRARVCKRKLKRDLIVPFFLESSSGNDTSEKRQAENNCRDASELWGTAIYFSFTKIRGVVCFICWPDTEE